MTDNQQNSIDAILRLDGAVQHLLRINWPESWLRLNLPFGSTRALLAIEGFNARTPGRVAEVLGINRTTVTGLLDRLEAEGLITRAINPHDRRSLVLHVTEQGRTLLQQIESYRHEQLALALATMDDHSLAALETGLQALMAAVRNTVTANETEEKEILKA